MTGIYARQSIERQDSVSIEAQIAQCLKFVDGGYQIYQDIGFSGKNTQRPAFERMLGDIEQGKVTTVISYRLDRISRSLNDFAKLLEVFDRHQVQYLSATEQFDSSSPIGRAMIYIVMVFAQLERETIALRIEDNYRYRARQGLYMGGNTPYGYSSQKIIYNGKRISILEIDPKQSAVLIKMVQLLCAGHTPAAIARILNNEAISNKHNKPWTSLGVRRILGNISPCAADQAIYQYLHDQGYVMIDPIECFDGQHGMSITLKTKNKNQATEIADQTVAIGMHPPILSSAQYIKAQHLLNNAPPSVPKASARSFLQGLVFCKACGSKMTIKATKYKNTSYRYFRCSGRSEGRCQNTRYIAVDALEDQLTQATAAHIRALPIPIKIIYDQQDLSTDTAVISMRIDALLNQIGKLDHKTDEMIMQKIQQLQTQLEYQNSKISEVASRDTAAGCNRSLSEIFGGFEQLSIPQKSLILQAAVEQITIDEDGEAEIAFKF